MRTSVAFRVAAALLVLALAMALNVQLERTALSHPALHSLYLPSGKYLRRAALGFQPLLADLLYIWSIQYYSIQRQDRWRGLVNLYDVIADLDPRFLAAYSIGALILGVEARRPEQALRLLDRGIRENPQTYFLAWEAGFYARDLGDPARASAYFKTAMSCPDAPPFVARWYYFTLEKAGQPREALRLWSELLENARDEHERATARRYVHDLTLQVTLETVAEAIRRFTAREGRRPVALGELVKAGDLADVPLDPAGNVLVYDRLSGEVGSAGGFLLPYRTRRP